MEQGTAASLKKRARGEVKKKGYMGWGDKRVAKMRERGCKQPYGGRKKKVIPTENGEGGGGSKVIVGLLLTGRVGWGIGGGWSRTGKEWEAKS